MFLTQITTLMAALEIFHVWIRMEKLTLVQSGITTELRPQKNEASGFINEGCGVF